MFVMNYIFVNSFLNIADSKLIIFSKQDSRVIIPMRTNIAFVSYFYGSYIGSSNNIFLHKSLIMVCLKINMQGFQYRNNLNYIFTR